MPDDTAPDDSAAGRFPLFYKNPVPLDAQRHGGLGLKKIAGLDFARPINAVPINMIEMPQLCHHYPIAFSPDDNATPVAILGLRDDENLFIGHKGEWAAHAYVPAYIRRYPFIFSEIPDSDQLTLCVDVDGKTVEEGGDQPFFDESGEPTTLSKNALEFCKSYHAASRQTLEFSKALQESGVLVIRQAEITVTGGRTISFSGFRIIDEKKLADLDDRIFIEWRHKGWLPFLYAHLFSGIQWQTLTRLLNDRMRKTG